MYRIQFKASAEKDFRKIGRSEGERIMRNIREKLALDPKIGIPLKASKQRLWRHRIGDYRVIYAFNDEECWILVVHIAHRREVYRDL